MLLESRLSFTMDMVYILMLVSVLIMDFTKGYVSLYWKHLYKEITKTCKDYSSTRWPWYITIDFINIRVEPLIKDTLSWKVYFHTNLQLLKRWQLPDKGQNGWVQCVWGSTVLLCNTNIYTLTVIGVDVTTFWKRWIKLLGISIYIIFMMTAAQMLPQNTQEHCMHL